ncbi:MAG: permease [Arachnia propionica]|nr:MAG: permease [Arachnia propionica]
MQTVASEPSVAKRKFSTRDLINVGVFTALYFVVVMIGHGLGMINPLLALVGFAVGILGNGAVIALYLARVPRLGALTLTIGLMGLLMAATGHPWFSLLICPAVGFIGDLIAWSGRFVSQWRNAVAYGVATLWHIVPMLPLVLDTAGQYEHLVERRGQEYADGYVAIFSGTNLAWAMLLFFGLAVVAGFFGQRLLSRHFRRAGVA